MKIIIIILSGCRDSIIVTYWVIIKYECIIIIIINIIIIFIIIWRKS